MTSSNLVGHEPQRGRVHRFGSQLTERLWLLYVGARRLEHLRYVGGDPLIARFCGLARIPTARTVGNWLRQFTQALPGTVVRGAG